MSRVELRVVEGIPVSPDIHIRSEKRQALKDKQAYPMVCVVGSRQMPVDAAIQVTRRVDDPQIQIDINKRLK